MEINSFIVRVIKDKYIVLFNSQPVDIDTARDIYNQKAKEYFGWGGFSWELSNELIARRIREWKGDVRGIVRNMCVVRGCSQSEGDGRLLLEVLHSSLA